MPPVRVKLIVRGEVPRTADLEAPACAGKTRRVFTELPKLDQRLTVWIDEGMMEALKRVVYHESLRGRRPALSDLAREALVEFLQRHNDKVNTCTEQSTNSNGNVIASGQRS